MKKKSLTQDTAQKMNKKVEKEVEKLLSGKSRPTSKKVFMLFQYLVSLTTQEVREIQQWEDKPVWADSLCREILESDLTGLLNLSEKIQGL